MEKETMKIKGGAPHVGKGNLKEEGLLRREKSRPFSFLRQGE